MRSEHIGCVLVGLGPAGAGFLFNAFRSGRLPELSAHGLLIVDGGEHLGSGRLGGYEVSANSVNDVFLNCLNDELLKDVLQPLEQLSVFRKMRDDPYGVSMLPDVAQVMGAATELLVEHIRRVYGVVIKRRTWVEAITQDRDEFQLRTRGTDGRQHNIRATSVVLNTGGVQTPELLLRGLRGMGLRLSPTDERIASSDAVLVASPKALRERFATALAGQPQITVVGGSHSAFSVVERLAVELEDVGLKDIALIHRSPIRLFFESVEEARTAGYRFDPQRDVCPVSGRVNRSGGLRYRAFAVGRGVLDDGLVPGTGVRVRTFCMEDTSTDNCGHVQDLLTSSVGVVQCIGYQPHLPTLYSDDYQPIILREVQGGLDSDASGCACDIAGRRLHGLYMFGLGSGLAVDPSIGSEASFHGRIYGVWQFHHDASTPALEAVLARNSRHRRAGAVTAGRRAAVRLKTDMPEPAATDGAAAWPLQSLAYR